MNKFLKLSAALIALSSYANAVNIFDFTAVTNSYPTATEAGLGNGSGWGSGITQNFNGANSVVNAGDQNTSTGNNPQTTTYNGPTFYAGLNRDQYQGSAGVIHNNGNGYRIRVNNVSANVLGTAASADYQAQVGEEGDADYQAQVGTAATGNGGNDVNFKAVFMFDAAAGDYVFEAGDTLTATVATPNNMNVRSSFASYRAMVMADGQYYAGGLNTIDLASLTGSNSSTRTFTENAASATWTLMDNIESSDNRLQSNANHPQNLTVDDTAATVVGSDLTGITQVGFLLETSSPVQTGGYNYGVRQFSAEATAAAVPEPSSYALIAGMLALASIMVRRR
jgi:hypothetical protein